MKKIALIATGGTISGVGSDRFDFVEYKTGSLTIDEMLAEIPELQQVATVTTSQFTNVSSCDLTPHHWLQLKREVEMYVHDDRYDGVVITHGTSTIEETAYFLHVTVATEKPIVLVGAQRPFSAAGSDATVNLKHAILVATSEKAYGKGVLVVANDLIHSARDVTKTHTYRIDGFYSGEVGALGWLDVDQQVHFYRKPTKIHTFQSELAKQSMRSLPNVGIIYSYAGADASFIEYIIKNQTYHGLVIAGTGAGRFSTAEKKALIKAAGSGIVVCRSTRVADGRVVPIGSFAPEKFITADNLHPQKARILLMLSLHKTKNIQKIQHIFNTY